VVTAAVDVGLRQSQLRPLLEIPGAPARTSAGEYRSSCSRIRDLTADALGGWHHVTNLQSGGGLFAQKLVTRKNYDIERAPRWP